MRPIHSRRKRTSLQDAHLFIKNRIGGGTKDSDYISDDDREKIVNEVTNDLINVVERNFPKTMNLEYAILKTHLIVEYALTQFIRCSSYVLVKPESIRFSYAQKLEISVLFGLGLGYPPLIPTLEIINKLRNQVAHKFKYDINLIDELIKINFDKIVNPLSNKKRISYLKLICGIVIGSVIGRVEAAVELTKKAEHKPKEDFQTVK